MTASREMAGMARWASGIASSALASWGLRRGGVLGVLGLIGAAALVWRTGFGDAPAPRPRVTRKASRVIATTAHVTPPKASPARKAASRKVAAKKLVAQAAKTTTPRKPAARKATVSAGANGPAATTASVRRRRAPASRSGTPS